MKDGDYYRWSYKQHVIDEKQDSVNAGTLYWCCARKAIFNNGRLEDIYWSHGSPGRSWSEKQAKADLDLTFLANADDIEEIKCNPKYYSPDDIINLNHPNRMGGIYIRKGAKRSRSNMRSFIMQKIDDEKDRLSSAKSNIDRLGQKLIDIETADLDKVYI